MRGQVIHIRFSTDLPTRAQNALRYRMELGRWRAKQRELVERLRASPDDPALLVALDIHDRAYEYVGLP